MFNTFVEISDHPTFCDQCAVWKSETSFNQPSHRQNSKSIRHHLKQTNNMTERLNKMHNCGTHNEFWEMLLLTVWSMKACFQLRVKKEFQIRNTIANVRLKVVIMRNKVAVGWLNICMTCWWGQFDQLGAGRPSWLRKWRTTSQNASEWLTSYLKLIRPGFTSSIEL